MPSITNATTNATSKWTDYDRQSVTTQDGKVDHGKSAAANVKDMGVNVKDAFTLNHFKSLNEAGKDSVLGFSMNVLLAPWAAMGEVADVVALPLKVAKNATDAVAHAAAKVVDWK